MYCAQNFALWICKKKLATNLFRKYYSLMAGKSDTVP